MEIKQNTKLNEKGKLDKSVFFGSFISLLVIALPIILFPKKSEGVINVINGFIINKLGFYYIWFGIFSIVFCLYIAFSKYGKIVLGEKGSKPEFKEFSWIAMLFCAGVGGGVVYWGIIEWVYYYSAPPLGAEFGSWQAAELAAAYGPFHWGPSAWAMYAVTSCAVAYILFIRKDNVLKLSEACRGALGNRVNGPIGKIIDIAFIFGLIGGVATSLGLGTPLITAAITRVFGITETIGLQIGVLFFVTAIFACSSYLGLKKGIKVISDINVYITFIVILFVFFVGDTIFIINMGTTAVGYVANNFIRMSTWLDPAGGSLFPQYWTVFYWAWWISFAPFQGMFIARISKGRTVKQMLLGAIFYGSAGCLMFFVVLGNYGLSLQVSGLMDVVGSLSQIGAPKTIVAIMENLPMSKIVIFLIGLLTSLFLATTYDSTSYILAANTQQYIGKSGEPIRWLRLLWAFSLALIPVGFIIIGSPLTALQTVSLIFALPVSVIIIIAGISFVKMVNKDIEQGKIELK